MEYSLEGELRDVTGTTYELTLRTIATTGLDLLPNGWSTIFGELIAELHKVNHPSRANIEFDGLTIRLGDLQLVPRFPDRVVHGIIRKYSQKLSCTCMRCGHPGQQRRWGLTRLPLCASCFGLRALQIDIKRLLDNLDREDRNEKDIFLDSDLAPRIRLLLADSWQQIQPRGQAIVMRCISATALRKEAPRLRSLLLELDRQLEGSTDAKPAAQRDHSD